MSLPWAGTTRTASACLNHLALTKYGWKRNGNPTRISQSASCKLVVTDFGCLPYLVGGDTGH